MSSSRLDEPNHDNKLSDEENEVISAMRVANGSVLPMVLRAAIELDLFEIMAKRASQGHLYLSSSEIASHLPTQNPQAPAMLERILRFLATNSILTSTTTSTDDTTKSERLYSLAFLGKQFVNDPNGVSLSSSLLFLQHKVVRDAWYHLKDAVLDGGIPFNKAHEMQLFDYLPRDSKFSEIVGRYLYSNTAIEMKMILEKYKGFEGVKGVVVDVGGCFGATLGIIVSKYPHIKGINFDLPHVIKDAPPCPGIEHIAGDMFEGVPKGEVIQMKSILHDWSDEHCSKILKNCWNALPESGKLIVMEAIMPEDPNSDLLSKDIVSSDLAMLVMTDGGKERTLKEYEKLARGSGFVDTKLVCCAAMYSIMEFHKTLIV